MKEDIQGELSAEIADRRKKIRFKAGTEMSGKVNMVVIDVEENQAGQVTSITLQIKLSS